MILLSVFAALALLLADVGDLWRDFVHRWSEDSRDWRADGAGRGAEM